MNSRMESPQGKMKLLPTTYYLLPTTYYLLPTDFAVAFLLKKAIEACKADKEATRS